MSIHVILGKPGSGKSLYAVTRVIRELVETERNIVTNLPILPDRLNEYVQQQFPRVNTRFVERLRLLSDEEMQFFWRYRGPASSEVSDAVGRLVLGEAPFGVAYFLDEAHIAFNARDWAKVGRDALHYLSQHRKLGDVVWPITQAPGNLDKQFRSVAEDFTVLRNEYVAKFGPFRGRGRFVRRTYLNEPSGNAEPFETATFRLDIAGVASCYDTARGIGVHGSKADVGRRAKGIPIWTVVPAALVLGCACVGVPYFLGKTVSAHLTGHRLASAVPVSSAAGASLLPAAGASVPVDCVSGVMMSGGQLYVATVGGGWSVAVSVEDDVVLLADGRRVSRRDVRSGGGVTLALERSKLVGQNEGATFFRDVKQ